MVKIKKRHLEVFSIHNNKEAKTSDEMSIKYRITIKFTIKGIADKSDVIGAIFGQTEGLLGDSLDLRDLQKSGRIGRIGVKIQYDKRKRRTKGTIVVPSSLNRVETAILAASLETVDRVGPCDAKVDLTEIKDIREDKREQIVDRATQILTKWERNVSLETTNLVEEVSKSTKVAKIQKYGPERLPAGPEINSSDSIIIVEGRADVLNLLQFGFNNAIACQGTSIPKTISSLSKKKVAIAFVDGDRGGALILRELLEIASIDFVARAPRGQEVEELKGNQILKALKNKVSADQLYQVSKEKKRKSYAKEQKHKKQPKLKTETIEDTEKLEKGKRVVKIRKRDRKPKKKHETPDRRKPKEPKTAEEIPIELKELFNKAQDKALLLDDKNNVIKEIEISNLVDILPNMDNITGVVFDGVVTQRLLDIAATKDIEFLFGAVKGEITRKPVKIKIFANASN